MKHSWYHEEKYSSTDLSLKYLSKIFVCVQIDILNNFLCGRIPLCPQEMHWNTPSNKELQKIVLNFEKTPHVKLLACLGRILIFY